MPADQESQTQGLNSSGDRPERTLAVQFSEIARTLQAETSLDATLQAVVESAVSNIDGADYAGITLVTGGGVVSTPASTDDLVVEIDRIQYETKQGPCLSAISDVTTVRANDLRDDTRWPKFSQRAVDLGVRSMLAFQLYVRERDLGALNLYSTSVDAFTDADEDIGLLFATHAAIAMVGAQHEHHLEGGRLNSDLIGQAKGILMERHKITAADAFQLLARASQNANRRLAEVALAVTRTGEEPQAPAE
jgi:hypothetical protein